MDEQRRRTPAVGAVTRRADVLALGSFVVLGLPDGMLGTAWPSMRVTFGAPVGDLGLILLLATAGSVLVTAFVGTLIRRLGVPALLVTAASCAAVGYAGFALAPGLGLVLGMAVLTGAAAGLMDAGLNTAVALSGRTRLLNLLHGAYGVGTALGPLVVTAAILTGSWRPAYLALTGLDLVIAGCWLRHRRQAAPAPPIPAPTAPSRPARPRPRPERPRRQSPGCPAVLRPAVVPAPLRLGGSHRDGRVLPLHRPRGGRRAMGGEFLPRSPEPVRDRDRASPPSGTGAR